MFRHPKYYKELRKRNKEEARAQLKVPSSDLDQAISNNDGLAQPVSVRLVRASSDKLQATSLKLQATSFKPQATSLKLKAASHKLHDT